MNFIAYFLPIYSSFWFLSLFFLSSGILFQNHTQHDSSPKLIIVASIILILFSIIKPNKHKIVMVGSFIIGATSLLLHNYYLQPPKQPITTANIQGVVKETIVTGNHFWPYRITLKMTAINQIKNKPILIVIYTKKDPLLEHNDSIEAESITVRYPTEKEFSLYLARQGAVGTAFVPQLQYTKTTPTSFSFFKTIEKIQNKLFKKLQKKMPRKTFAFFSSLFIGDKKRVKDTIDQHKDPFKFWGLSHQLARSGLHLLLFIFIWTLVMSFLPIPYLAKTLLLIAISFCYWVFTPMSVSFLRAFSVFIIYKLCNMLSIAINPLHILSIVCFFTLLFNPFHLFFLDFQLSFFLAFCLVWLSQLNLQRRILLIK